MKLTKKSGRLLGLLFLASVITGGTGTALRNLTGVKTNSIDFLNHVLAHVSEMKLAIYTDILSSIIVLGIAIFVFPYIKKYNQRLAISYFGIGLINFIVIIVSNIIHIALLSVSTDFANSGATVIETNYTVLANMLYDMYYWSHFLMLMFYSIGGSMLYYFLYKVKLIPTWLSIWGLLASAIVFMGGALQMADVTVSFLMFVQNGVFILSFIIWLLVFGFNTEKFNNHA
ncbi:DUF4386 domain-containing protein [Aquimarina sp. AD10]|uniref:DUF4386 domain-containing protein n=1 Tax=Aquimarina sp. AD10 TaxID=1714849 RepID=UPI000E4ABCA3|nr:DUF4386 domain-containing protein [Aquimarina sp. AD10]AXT58915.1 DUF4386 domain-containing protein [Aquimarina sp. AD10]RKM99608.1 DUF4386 family protein [Aquimarina sp. AD10]